MGEDVQRFETEVAEDLKCPYCYKVLKSPISSTCGHTFCAECMHKATQRGSYCPQCTGQKIERRETVADKNTEELEERLSKLAIHCTHQSSGCTTVLPWCKLTEHAEKECVYRRVSCPHKNCTEQPQWNGLEKHTARCDYRIVECRVCKARLVAKDMPAHQAVKRCFEELNKRRRVASARRISTELKEHQLEMLHKRHLTEQAERRIQKEHYFTDTLEQQQQQPLLHRRAMSAGPILMRSRSVESRVGSGPIVTVPHYSRNIKSAALDSCRGCSNRFLAGRRPSARRHSHSKVSKIISSRSEKHSGVQVITNSFLMLNFIL